MRIVDNVAAMRVLTNLGRTDRAINRSTVRLSSGFRINSAGDDPAGFAISLKLRRQVSGMEMADRNTLDGVSLLETADAALQTVHDIMQRIRELSVQAANDTNTYEDRINIQKEVNSLLTEINDITRKIEFNNIRLLDGEANNLHIQIGGRQGMQAPITIPSFTTWALDLTSVHWHAGQIDYDNNIFPWQDGFPPQERDDPDFDPDNHWHVTVGGRWSDPDEQNANNWPSAQDAISRLDAAIRRVSYYRAGIGAYINRFEYTSQSLRAATEATARSLSRVMDTDMAHEMMMLSKNNILSQAGMSILAQANARPQQVLQLIG